MLYTDDSDCRRLRFTVLPYLLLGVKIKDTGNSKSELEMLRVFNSRRYNQTPLRNLS